MGLVNYNGERFGAAEQHAFLPAGSLASCWGLPTAAQRPGCRLWAGTLPVQASSLRARPGHTS